MINRLKTAYQIYVYSTPIPVLSKEETIILNTIISILLSVILFCILNILKAVTVNSIEYGYYIITGDFIPISALLNTLLATRLMSQYKVDLFGNVLSSNQTSM
ncbi:unnamed protein product [Debaryomyces tyrocola]|nr:unnamed protein product [Debaryomyces tyrocola]